MNPNNSNTDAVIHVYPSKVAFIDSIPLQYISEALQFRLDLIDQGYWTRLLKHDDVVDVTYGRTLSNGLEKAIGTRTYYMYGNEVMWHTRGHL